MSKVETFVDSCNNTITVEETKLLDKEGCRLGIARLVENPSKGYVFAIVGDGGFGDEKCPSSYNRPCHNWFGPEDDYKTSRQAIEACWDVFSVIDAMAETCATCAHAGERCQGRIQDVRECAEQDGVL